MYKIYRKINNLLITHRSIQFVYLLFLIRQWLNIRTSILDKKLVGERRRDPLRIRLKQTTLSAFSIQLHQKIKFILRDN